MKTQLIGGRDHVQGRLWTSSFVYFRLAMICPPSPEGLAAAYDNQHGGPVALGPSHSDEDS